MMNYPGFKAILRFQQRNQPTEFIFDQMLTDYITENSKDYIFNWRPRKSYKDAEFIEKFPESSISFDEIKEIYALIINQIDRLISKPQL